jgi:hypothetical protein
MTMNINGPRPREPESDETARRRARAAIRDMLGNGDESAGRCGPVADHLARHHSVTWERDADSAGRAVRRYVLRGNWELDQPDRMANPVEAALRHVYERINQMVTTDQDAIADCLGAVRAEAHGWGVTL